MLDNHLGRFLWALGFVLGVCGGILGLALLIVLLPYPLPIGLFLAPMMGYAGYVLWEGTR